MIPISDFKGLILITLGLIIFVPGLIYSIQPEKHKAYLKIKLFFIFSIFVVSFIFLSKGISMAFHVPSLAIFLLLKTLDFMHHIFWEVFLFGMLITATAVITGPHEETGFFKILWRVLITIGLLLMISSLVIAG